MQADLSAVTELEARHLNVLHGKLGITTPEALVRADRRTVHAAMGRVRPRPSLEDVSRWQDAARDLVPPGPPAIEPGWDQVAAFVVSFEASRTERRVVISQAEHVAPEPVTVLDGWQMTSEAGAWMLGHVPAKPTRRPAAPTSAEPAHGSNPPAAAPPARTVPPPLRFLAVTVGRGDGDPVTLDPGGGTGTAPGVSSPQWVEVDVGGVASSVPVQVAVRALRDGRPGLTVSHRQVEPGTGVRGRPVRLPLDRLPPDRAGALVVAWTEHGEASPCSLALPALLTQ